jgi:hypothetical protein
MWASSVLVESAPAGLSAVDSAFYGGLISGIAVFAAALVVGWICGGLLMESDCEVRNTRCFLWRLAVAGGVSILCIGLGAYPLAGTLIMTLGCAAGLVGRRALCPAAK